MNTEQYDEIPEDLIHWDFCARCANPRGLMPPYVARWWTPGVSADADSGRAASTQAHGRPTGEVISVRDYDIADTFAAEARFARRHARWSTERR